jgi:hypothetical protein
MTAKDTKATRIRACKPLPAPDTRQLTREDKRRIIMTESKRKSKKSPERNLKVGYQTRTITKEV